jgi:N-acetylneuraminic acid mutarotase
MISRSFELILIGALMVCAGSGAAPLAGANWHQISTWADPRGEAASAVDPATGLVYLLGGYAGAPTGFPVGTAESFDPKTGTWRTLAAMPVPVRGATAVFDSTGGIYLYGGYSPTELAPTYQVYSIATNTWGAQSPQQLHIAQFGPSAAAVGHIHYIQGGEAGPTSFVDFNVSSGFAGVLATAPNPHYNAGLSLVGRKIYAFGGFTVAANEFAPVSAALDAFDLDHLSWSASPTDMALARASFAYGSDGQDIYVAGGTSKYFLATAPFFSSFEFYDSGADTWQGGPDLPIGVREPMGAVSNGEFLVFGGVNASGASSAVYAISVPENAAEAAIGAIGLGALSTMGRRKRGRMCNEVVSRFRSPLQKR